MADEIKKVSVRFKKPHSMTLAGKQVNFRADQIVLLDVEVARELFRTGVVLPGPQYT